jgi:hypothetical protein
MLPMPQASDSKIIDGKMGDMLTGLIQGGKRKIK